MSVMGAEHGQGDGVEEAVAVTIGSEWDKCVTSVHGGDEGLFKEAENFFINWEKGEEVI